MGFLFAFGYPVSTDKNTHKNPLDNCGTFAAAACQNWPFFGPDLCMYTMSFAEVIAWFGVATRPPRDRTTLAFSLALCASHNHGMLWGDIGRDVSFRSLFPHGFIRRCLR